MSDPAGGGLVSLAERLARRYHAGHTDASGRPYIEHPAGVVGLLGNRPELWRAAAWLHDVLEHTDATATDLRAQGVPDEVVGLVEVLSRRPGEEYLDFIGRVTQDPVAVAVKMADTLDKLGRPAGAGPSPEQLARYRQALVALFEALPVDS